MDVSQDEPARPSRTREVADYLRDYIAAHHLRAGSPLPGEMEISRTLGISRPSVREASAVLGAIGLINVGNGRRPCVGTLGHDLGGGVLRDVLEAALVTDQADLRQVMEVRRGLEVEMAALAAARRLPDHLEALHVALKAMATTLHDRAAYAKADLRFHILLGQATGNPLYAVLVADAQQALLSSLAQSLRAKAGRAELARVQRLHEAIVQAVAGQDGPAARRAMTDHFNDAERALQRLGNQREE